MVLQTLNKDSQSPRRRRLIAAAVLAVGLIVAAVAVWLGWQELRTPVAPLTGLVEDQGMFPVASLYNIANDGARPDAGFPAPDFAIHLPDGSTTSLSAYRGRPVIVNMWASWCEPCRLEMPDLARAYAAHKDDDLVILEVNIAEPHEKVAAFVQEFGMTMPVVIDPRQEVQDAYKTQSLPSSFFIDRDGVIRVRWIGLLTPDLLEQHLRSIL